MVGVPKKDLPYSKGSVCKFPKDCFDDHLALDGVLGGALPRFRTCFSSSSKYEDGLQRPSAPKPCLLCIKKESAEQFQAFPMEPSMFGKVFKNKADRFVLEMAGDACVYIMAH